MNSAEDRRSTTVSDNNSSEMTEGQERPAVPTGGLPMGKLKIGVAILLLSGVWLILCKPWFSGGRVVPWDSKSEFYPSLYFVSQALRDGNSPFWNPYIFSGYPMISDPQSMIFSPLALGLMIAVDKPSMQWFDAIELIHLLLGGIGILLLSARYRWTVTAGLCAALVYMFGGSASARMEHVPMIYTYGYFPFAFLFLEMTLATMRRWYGVCFGVVAGIMAAQQNQVAYLFCLVLMGYVLHQAISSGNIRKYLDERRRALVAASLSGMLTLAIPIYTTLQFLPLSNRPSIPYQTAVWGSLHPLSFLTLFAPNFFGNSDLAYYWGFQDITESYLYAGTLAIVLIACFGVPRGVVFSREFRFFLIAGIFGVLYAIGGFTPFYWIAYHVIPGVKLYRRPPDATFLINFVVSVATGLIMDKLLTGALPRVKRTLIFIECIVLAGLFVWGIRYGIAKGKTAHLPTELRLAALYASIAIGLLWGIMAIRSRKVKLVLGFLVLALLAVDLRMYNVGSLLNAHDAASVSFLVDAPLGRHPSAQLLRGGLDLKSQAGGPYRADIARAGYFLQNSVMNLKIQGTLGYNPLRYLLYDRATGNPDAERGPKGFGTLLTGFNSPFLNMLGVKYIVSVWDLKRQDPQVDEKRFPLVFDQGLKIWENPGVLPRVLAVTSFYVEPEMDQMIAAGRMAPVDYRHVIVIPHLPRTLAAMEFNPGVVNSLPGEGPAQVRIEKYRNAEVTLSVDTNRDIILLLNDLYYPYWRVYVDGHERELLQANYIFRAVHVKSGERNVTFRFEPFSWYAIKGTLIRNFPTIR